MESLVKHLRPGEHALCLTSTAFLVDTNSQVNSRVELKIPQSWFRADLAWTVFRCHVHPKHNTIKIIDNLLLFNAPIQDSSIRRWICVMAAAQFGCSVETEVEVDIKRPKLKFTDIKLSGDMFTKHNLSDQFTNRKVTDDKLQRHLQKHLKELVGDILEKDGPIDHVLANLSLTNDPNVFTWIKRTSNEDRGYLLLLTQQQGKNISFLVSPKLEFFLLSKVDLPRHWWKQSVFVCLLNSTTGKVNVVDLLSSNGIRYDKHGMIRDMMCRVFVTQASKASPWIGLQPRFNLPDDDNSSDVWIGLVQNSSQYSMCDLSAGQIEPVVSMTE
jgi:hypothetical protein